MPKIESIRRSARKRSATVRTRPDKPESSVQRPKLPIRPQRPVQAGPKAKKNRVEILEPSTPNVSENPMYEYSSDSDSAESSTNSDGEREGVSPPPPPLPQLATQPRRYRIKKKGHQMQHAFNNRVLKQVELALDSIFTKPAEAQVALLQARKEILYRQKILRIADKNGWDAVTEYESSGIGENEADEKKIKKAVKAAERKREGMMAQRFRRRRNPLLPFPAGGSAAQTPLIQPLFAAARPPTLQIQRQTFGNQPMAPGKAPFAGGGGKMPIKIRKLQSICFTCGIAGHWSGDAECKGGQFQGYF